ncbi:MAG: oxalurate catabolism protein HpxZ [Thermoanaerobaculia bacterium]
MIVNDPKTLAEVEAECAGYEKALTINDVDALNSFFWQDGRAIRYGLGENLYGHAEIAAFRAAQSSGAERTLSRTVITTFGTEFATASTLFHHPSFAGAMGRRMQTWAKIDRRWRIVAAHVSLM